MLGNVFDESRQGSFRCRHKQDRGREQRGRRLAAAQPAVDDRYVPERERPGDSRGERRGRRPAEAGRARPAAPPRKAAVEEGEDEEGEIDARTLERFAARATPASGDSHICGWCWPRPQVMATMAVSGGGLHA